ncbi:MAG: hypothetical protein ACHQF3_06795, partial [Alphaproteobacteria bacterium]
MAGGTWCNKCRFGLASARIDHYLKGQRLASQPDGDRVLFLPAAVVSSGFCLLRPGYCAMNFYPNERIALFIDGS